MRIYIERERELDRERERQETREEVHERGAGGAHQVHIKQKFQTEN